MDTGLPGLKKQSFNMPEQDNCPHNNIESNMCPLHCTDCGKVLEQDNWKERFVEQFTDKVDAENDYYDSQFTEGRPSRVIDFIESLLSSQPHALKEQMKACVENADINSHSDNLIHGGEMMKEKILSAIESIEI